ncbi:MAG TPA: sugar transferase [Terracidiphilus sp.]|nr:sugar transferase [Terracidiphilus sp.]
MLDTSALRPQPCRQASSTSCGNCLNTPPASPWTLSRTRRILDLLIASIALVFFAAPMTVLAICVRLTSEGGALFIQERMGRSGRLFRIYKFRSMVQRPANEPGMGITRGGDHRVTAMGRFMRAFKLDELPQFYNILRGDMSLVGPRPKLPQHTALSNMPYRPGLTGWATVAFRREEELLRTIDPQKMLAFYMERLNPLKAQLDACYMCRATFASDFRILLATLLGCLIPSHAPAAIAPALASLNTSAYRILDRPSEAGSAGG